MINTHKIETVYTFKCHFCGHENDFTNLVDGAYDKESAKLMASEYGWDEVSGATACVECVERADEK